MARTVDRFAVGMAAATVALIFVALAAGCSGATEEHGQERFGVSDDACSTSVIVDVETGVQYLCVRVYDNSVSVTPLIDQWGFPLLADGHQRGPTVGQSMDVDEKGMVGDE